MAHPRICVAIRRQEPLDLVLEEGVLRFEPYEHGWVRRGEAEGGADRHGDGDRVEVLAGVVTDAGGTGWEEGWVEVPVGSIRDVQPTGGSFMPRVGYDLDEAVLPEVHCRLLRHGHREGHGW